MEQKWFLELNGGKVRQMRAKLGLDLLNPNDHFQVLNSLTDRIAFVFLLCEDQAKEYDVDADEFEERLYGDGFMDEASTAFLRCCSDFFLKVGQKGLAMLTDRAIESIAAGQKKMEALLSTGQLDSLLTKAQKESQQQMDELLRENVGKASSSSQRSPDKTGAPSPSGNSSPVPEAENESSGDAQAP